MYFILQKAKLYSDPANYVVTVIMENRQQDLIGKRAITPNSLSLLGFSSLYVGAVADVPDNVIKAIKDGQKIRFRFTYTARGAYFDWEVPQKVLQEWREVVNANANGTNILTGKPIKIAADNYIPFYCAQRQDEIQKEKAQIAADIAKKNQEIIEKAKREREAAEAAAKEEREAKELAEVAKKALDPGPLPDDWHNLAKTAILNSLKDPYSAYIQLSEEPYKKRLNLYKSDGVWKNLTVIFWTGFFQVNAKNSFGAYTGYQEWIFVFRDNKLFVAPVKAFKPEDDFRGISFNSGMAHLQQFLANIIKIKANISTYAPADDLIRWPLYR